MFERNFDVLIKSLEQIENFDDSNLLYDSPQDKHWFWSSRLRWGFNIFSNFDKSLFVANGNTEQSSLSFRRLISLKNILESHLRSLIRLKIFQH